MVKSVECLLTSFLTFGNKQRGKKPDQTEEDGFYELCHANSFWIKAPPGQCEPDISKPIFTLAVMSQGAQII